VVVVVERAQADDVATPLAPDRINDIISLYQN
jgi:hypothetical protein